VKFFTSKLPRLLDTPGLPMKTSRCHCGGVIFFNNQRCITCGKTLGLCSSCRDEASFSEKDDGTLVCDRMGCQAEVLPCKNRDTGVCMSMVPVGNGELCEWCQFTEVVPDLSDPFHQAYWAELERAKRRLLLQLEELELPPFGDAETDLYPLRFRFMADGKDESDNAVPVYTGHAEGVITVNIREADSVYRESTRVLLREPQRTVIGHFRHEIGHYIDWALVQRRYAEPYRQLFGDFNLDYEAAKQRHYDEGPPANWHESHVSAYASMHPCEDFAETVNAYLDMMAIAVTANDQKVMNIDIGPKASIQSIVQRTLQIAIMVSEFNLDLGLAPLLPETFSPLVLRKLEFVHQLRSPDALNSVSAEPASAEAPAS
jgi:hypothetical protein